MMIFIGFLLLASLAASMPIKLDGPFASSGSLAKRGFWSSVLSIFDSTTPDLTASTAATSIALVASPTAATAATAAASISYTSATSQTSSSGDWLAKLLGLFGNSNAASTSSTLAAYATQAIPATVTASTSAVFTAEPVATWQSLYQPSASYVESSSTLEASTAPTTTSLTPGFTGLVTVIGAGGAQTTPTGTSPSTNTPSSSGSGTASNSQIQAVAKYAEMGAGISYSPYTKSGACKTAAEVKQDIQQLSAYSLIRLYSVDCSGVQNVVEAMSSSQKLFLGVWDITALGTDLPSMAQQVLTGNRGWEAVHTVSIGNEVVNSGTNTVAQVASAVSSARAWFKQNAPGYTGYIVAVDTLSATMVNSQMCDIGDYIAVNCHPYFSGIEASTSGTWLKQQIDSLSSFCGGSKSILITESGWPTQGNIEGQAVPSVANQLLAIKGLGTTLGNQVMMFTTFNDYWKAPGSWNVEQHWGVYGDPDY